LAGIWIGSGLFAAIYPKLNQGILKWGYFGDVTLPKLLKVNDWIVVLPVAALIILILVWMENTGM
jgi:hypothetical protein